MIKRGSKRYRNIINNAKAYIKEHKIEHPDDANTYRIKINLNTGKYRLEPIKNSQELVKSLKSPDTYFDYDLVAQNLQDAIKKHDLSTVKDTIHLINCSLFADEDNVNQAFKAISHIHCYKQDATFEIIFRELLRLNIWALISEGRKALQHKYKFSDYLEGVYLNSTSSLAQDGNYLPRDLRMEMKSALDGTYDKGLATRDVVQFLAKHHFLIARKTLLLICFQNMYYHLRPISYEITNQIKFNNYKVIATLLNSAKIYVNKITRNSNLRLNESFPSFVHKLLIDIPARQINPNTTQDVLRTLGKFDLYLTSLIPKTLVKRNDFTMMRKGLSNLVAKSKYFHKMGIRLTLSKSIDDMTDFQVKTALETFNDFIRNNVDFILGEIIANKVL